MSILKDIAFGFSVGCCLICLYELFRYPDFYPAVMFNKKYQLRGRMFYIAYTLIGIVGYIAIIAKAAS